MVSEKYDHLKEITDCKVFAFAMAAMPLFGLEDDGCCVLPLSPTATITSNEDEDLDLFPDLVELWANHESAVTVCKSDTALQNGDMQLNSGDDAYMKHLTFTLSSQSCSNSHAMPVATDHVKNENIDDSGTLSYERRRSGVCMTKSAIAARENRMKKKGFVRTLQSSVQLLTSENKTLHQQVSSLQAKVGALQTEVMYLKGVLRNESSLASLLQNIHTTPGVEFVCSDQLGLAEGDDDSDSEDTDAYVGRKRHSVGDYTFKENVPAKNSAYTHTRPGMRKLAKLDHDYASQDAPKHVGTKRQLLQGGTDVLTKQSYPGGGICLHVSDKSVSLELCAACNKNASSARKTYGLRKRSFAGKKSN